MVHVRRLPGAAPDAPPPSFGHSGWLWHDAFLLYDHETESLWHHLTGRALSGPRRGEALPSLPAVLTRWSAWRETHPETLVLPKPDDHEAPVHLDVYATRNLTLQLGTGVRVGGEDRLYPWGRLRVPQVVHDELGGVPVVVVHEHGLRTAAAWRLPDPELELVAARDDDGRLVLAELDGDGRWNPWSGRAVPPGSSADLLPVRHSTWDTAAWRRQHPHGSEWTGR